MPRMGRPFKARTARTLARDLRYFERLAIALPLDKRLDPFEVARVQKQIVKVVGSLRALLATMTPTRAREPSPQIKLVG